MAHQGKLGDHLFGNRRGTDAQMAIWASLQIEARALGSGHAVASSFYDVTNCFPSVLHATMQKDLAEVGASEELLALNALLHQDVAYEVRSPSAPGAAPAETVHVAGDAIGFVQGQRAAPAVSTVVMDRRVAHVQQERRAHRPAQEFTVTYRELAGTRGERARLQAGEEVTLVANDIVYADDLNSFQVFPPSSSPGPIIASEVECFKHEFERESMQFDLGEKGKSGFLKVPIWQGARCSRRTKGLGRLAREPAPTPSRRFRHPPP